MKHLSAFVEPGDVKLTASGDAENTIAFLNPVTNEVKVLCYNAEEKNAVLNLNINGKKVNAELTAKSFNTLAIRL
jgi:glucosylceramidase